MKTVFTTNIASVPDREDLVAEVWLDKVLFVEMRKEPDGIIAEIYARPDKKPWTVSSGELIEALARAKARLETMLA